MEKRNSNIGSTQKEEKRKNEIIRIQKKQHNFVMLDKGFLEDNRLSYKAKGILSYLLSKPDNWKVIIKDLIAHSSDGEKAIYSGLRELKQHGYYKKIPIRNDSGQRISYWESVIYECPEEQQEDNKNIDTSTEKSENSLLADFVQVENVHVQNRQHNNNNNSKNKISKNKSINQELPENEKVPPETETIDTIDNIKKQVSENIALENLQQNNPTKQKEIQELYAIIIEILASRKKSFRIAKEELPAPVVKEAFSRLNALHIEYVLQCLKSTTTTVKSTKAYLLTTLYNAAHTMNNHYSLAAQHQLSENPLYQPR